MAHLVSHCKKTLAGMAPGAGRQEPQMRSRELKRMLAQASKLTAAQGLGHELRNASRLRPTSLDELERIELARCERPKG